MNNPLPKEHPPVKPQKIGVLMMNLGTPDDTGYFAVRRYLSEFLSDKRVIDAPSWFWQPLLQGVILTTRPFRSGKAYASIWDKKTNESPLLVYTRAITEKVKAEFADEDEIIVDFAMRYGNPSTASVLQKLLDQGCDKIFLMALYPQYSATTMATAARSPRPRSTPSPRRRIGSKFVDSTPEMKERSSSKSVDPRASRTLSSERSTKPQSLGPSAKRSRPVRATPSSAPTAP